MEEARLRHMLVHEIPLPPCWVAVTREDGKAEYVNELTGERQASHPAEEYIQSRLNTAERGIREGQGEAPLPSAQSSLSSKQRDAAGPTTAGHRPPTGAGEVNWRREASPFGAWRQEMAASQNKPSLYFRPETRSKRETPIPPELTFTSWWAEESVANPMVWKHVEIAYVVRTGEFRVRFQGSPDMVTVSHVIGKNGPFTEYDLHVGATLRLLGRSITLKQADRPTTAWLETERRRLMSIRDRLASELAKYEVAYERLPDLYVKQEAGFRNKELKGQLGLVPLRRYRVEVRELYHHLREIRPKLADKLEKEIGGC